MMTIVKTRRYYYCRRKLRASGISILSISNARIFVFYWLAKSQISNRDHKTAQNVFTEYKICILMAYYITFIVQEIFPLQYCITT